MNRVTQQYLILYLLIIRNLKLSNSIAGYYSFDHNNSLDKLEVLPEDKSYIYRHRDIYEIQIPSLTLDNIPKTFDVKKLQVYNNLLKSNCHLDIKYQELVNWTLSNCIIFHKTKGFNNQSSTWIDVSLNFKDCTNNFNIEKISLLQQISSTFLYEDNNKNRYNFLVRDLNNNVDYNIGTLFCNSYNKHLFYIFDVYAVIKDSVTINYWKRKDLISSCHKEQVNDVSKFANSF
jgi:hypothetical protein